MKHRKYLEDWLKSAKKQKEEINERKESQGPF